MKDLFGYSYTEPWFFTNYSFLLVLGFFLIIYGLFSPKSIWKKIYLIIFSLFFYYKSSGPYLGIFALMIVFDYNMARLIDHLNKTAIRKLLLFISICCSLSFLIYFKYSGFILLNINNLFGSEFEISSLFLPIGISFYTFQSISYIVDVYKKKITTSNNFIDYAFYMTFFPHLVAGPIVRAKDFMPQIDDPIKMDQSVVSSAIFRIMTGLTKKLFIADLLAKYVDMVHVDPSLYSGLENWISMYAYTFQIYFDFSGYSDIAIGIALLLGYRLNENFENPYRSFNITDFWRRWHISLSSWLRDYIYIPLGGNRKGELNTYLFLLITMTVGGIWHGADWKFVVWGVLHGLALAIHKLYNKLSSKNDTPHPGIIRNIISGFITFHFVALLWILFRAESFSSALLSIKFMAQNFDPKTIIGFYMVRKEVLIMLLISSLWVFSPSIVKIFLEKTFSKIPAVLGFIILMLLLQLILQFKDQEIQPFIYFQF